MYAIEIMESVFGITTLVANSREKISALRQASIHPEAVKSRWKQVHIISRLSDAFHSIESGMLLVHIYEHQNIGKSESTLTPLAPLNVRLSALVEHIMASFLLSPATRNTTAVGLLDPYGLSSVSIHGFTVNYNLAHSIAYKISKHRLLQ